MAQLSALLGNAALAGDTYLTLSAAVAHPLVGAVGRQVAAIDATAANDLILAQCASFGNVDRTEGASLGAGAAHDTVFKGIGIGARGRGERGIGDDTAKAACHSFFCDQTFGKAKGAKACGESGMAL